MAYPVISDYVLQRIDYVDDPETADALLEHLSKCHGSLGGRILARDAGRTKQFYLRVQTFFEPPTPCFNPKDPVPEQLWYCRYVERHRAVLYCGERAGAWVEAPYAEIVKKKRRRKARTKAMPPEPLNLPA